MKSLKSSVEDIGEVVSEVIHFKSDHQKTFEGILTDSIRVGSFTKFKTTKGVMVGINHREVEWFEVHK